MTEEIGFQYVIKLQPFQYVSQYRYLISFKIIFTFLSVYWCILDGADINRQFIKIHFKNEEAVTNKFVAHNIYTQGRREAERAPGQYFGPGPVCLKVRRGGGTHGLVG